MFFRILVFVVFSVPALAAAQGMRYPWEEYDKLIKRHTEVSAMSSGVFGESLDFYTGGIGFSVTDISLPGNGLPINVSRSLSVANRADYRFDDLPMADWNMDLPRLSGTFLATTGWASPCNHQGFGGPPVVTVGGRRFSHTDYWQGNRMVLPGQGSQEMMIAESNNLPRPSQNAPYPWLTQDFTWFSCLASRINEVGDAFVGHLPDGTRYTFNWVAAFNEPDLASPSQVSVVTVARRRVELYATRVEDRFGNWLAYRYSNSPTSPIRLEEITSGDGRVVRFTYNARGHVESISTGARTWRYRYAYPDQYRGSLVAVELPDGSSWAIDASAASHIEFQYERSTGTGDILRSCGYPGLLVNEPGAIARFVHPSGAVGEFTVGYGLRGRSNVPMVCNGYTRPYNDPNDDVARYPLAYHGVVLRKKRISGPGVNPAEWNYSYGGSISFAEGTGPVCTSGDCSLPRCLEDACSGTSITTVAGPGNTWERHTYGNSYRYNEGKLLKVEQGRSPDSILQTTVYQYLWPLPGTQFATRLGNTQQPRSAGYTAEYLRPLVSTRIVRNGVLHSSSNTAFDGFGRPLSTVSESATLPPAQP